MRMRLTRRTFNLGLGSLALTVQAGRFSAHELVAAALLKCRHHGYSHELLL